MKKEDDAATTVLRPLSLVLWWVAVACIGWWVKVLACARPYINCVEMAVEFQRMAKTPIANASLKGTKRGTTLYPRTYLNLSWVTTAA